MARKAFICTIVLVLISLQAAQAVYITVEEDAGCIKIITSRLITWIPKVNPVMAVTDRSGQLIYRDTQPFWYQVDGAIYTITFTESFSRPVEDTVVINCYSTQSGKKVGLTLRYLSASSFNVDLEPLDAGSVSWCGTAFEAGPEEHFYGLGQPRTGSLDLRGKKITVSLKADARDELGRSYDETSLMPFFLSTNGYGIFIDSYTEGSLDFASSTPDSCKSTWPVKRLNYYFFYGPEFRQIVDQYTALTGRPPLPPKWQFGLARWLKPTGVGQVEILADAQLFRTNDIPASMIWIEPQWQTVLNSFTFRTDIFPDPQGMMDQLHQMGYKVAAWMTPYNINASPTYTYARGRGYYVMNSSGQTWETSCKNKDYYADTYVSALRSFIDLTDNAAVTWWHSQLQQALDYGFDGFKIDRGQEIISTCRFDNGETGSTMHNKYAYYTAKVHYEFLSSRKPDDFILLYKSGLAGSQSFLTCLWPGDQQGDFSSVGLPRAVFAVQSAGLAGFPFWTSDIGGFYTNMLKEVFLRWTSFAAFTPSMETPTAPWQFDSETTSIFRFYTKLHYELIPYIYSLAYLSHQKGEPIVRPLVYEYRTDPSAIASETQFMLGPSILVAPVTSAGASSKQVYLPRGCWVDYWDSTRVFYGPRTVTASAPLSGIPVFVRAGGIIPMDVVDDVCGHGNTSYKDSLTIDCYPRGVSSFNLFYDGTSKTIRSVMSYPRWRLEIPAVSKGVIVRALTQGSAPSSVRLNGSSLTKQGSQSAFDSSSSGWYFTDGRLLVKYPANTKAVIQVVM